MERYRVLSHEGDTLVLDDRPGHTLSESFRVAGNGAAQVARAKYIAGLLEANPYN